MLPTKEFGTKYLEEILMNQKLTLLIAVFILTTVSGLARGQSARQSQPSKVEVGALFSVLRVCDPNGLCDVFPRTERGIGARISYNLTSYFAVEGEIDFFPRNYRKVISNFTGGRITQGLFGVKAGMRKNRFGVFGKFRPGLQSSGHAEIAHFPSGNGPDRQNPFGFESKRATQLALDVGGVLEVYPSRRTIVRFDLGDTIVRYPGLQFIHFPEGSVVLETVYSHKPQFSAGFGFRF
jgi:hypothetical protein